jgi:hypothetical protein
MSWASPYIKGFLGAVVGLVFGLLIWHAYVDHVLVHQVVAVIQQAQAQAQRPAAAKPPTP